MKAGEDVVIRRVTNGFVVTGRPDIRHGDMTQEVVVFQKLYSDYEDSLLEWLKEHFKLDAKQKQE